jgi:HAD superfamily hydrolase (TIGR01509 family)
LTLVQALIFDFDGTIIDTESAEFQGIQEFYERHGVSFSLELWLPVIGTNEVKFDAYAHLETLIGTKLDRAASRKAVKARVMEIIQARTALPGVEGYLLAAKEHGLKLGVASSSELPWVEGHLKRLGLLHHFDAIRTREWVERTKPDPALFLRAAEALGVEPSGAIAIEDSLNGVRAAKTAGMFTLAVPNPITRYLDLSGADLVVESLSGLPLAELLKQARG